MSRIGRKPIEIPKSVNVQVTGKKIAVQGPKGELHFDFHPDIQVEIKDEKVIVTRPSDKRLHRSLHGLTRSLIQNQILGVLNGYSKKLEIVGVGYKVELRNGRLNLALGFSHPIVFAPPPGITFETPSPTNIIVKGMDKALVGLVAAKIRSFRPPEPYKGKGVKYEGEMIRRKAGKTAA